MTRAGVRVPEDVSVIGFDGSRVGAFTSPGLASIRQMTDEIGRSAASLLLRLLANPRSGEPQRVVVPCDLLTRESIAPPAEAKAAETEVLPGHRRAATGLPFDFASTLVNDITASPGGWERAGRLPELELSAATRP